MDPLPHWYDELDDILAGSRPTLSWLPRHLLDLMPREEPTTHLLAVTSDLCDAGHVHLDVVLWVLFADVLAGVLVGEEHYDRGPQDVETTFETTLNLHPLDTVAGVQLATAAHPDGLQLDASLSVVLSTHGVTGHADPVPYDDEDVAYHLHTQPASLTFSTEPGRTEELIAFADALLTAREQAVRRR